MFQFFVSRPLKPGELLLFLNLLTNAYYWQAHCPPFFPLNMLVGLIIILMKHNNNDEDGTIRILKMDTSCCSWKPFSYLQQKAYGRTRGCAKTTDLVM